MRAGGLDVAFQQPRPRQAIDVEEDEQVDPLVEGRARGRVAGGADPHAVGPRRHVHLAHVLGRGRLVGVEPRLDAHNLDVGGLGVAQESALSVQVGEAIARRRGDHGNTGGHPTTSSIASAARAAAPVAPHPAHRGAVAAARCTAARIASGDASSGAVCA